MTKLAADATCKACGGMLVPPEVANVKVPEGTDYVCLKCETPYRWLGNPPRLLPIIAPTK